MSDEFEAISVEAESPVVSGGTESVAPVAIESFGAEPMGVEIEATQINLNPADDALKQNSQQAYLEINAPDRAGSGPAVTIAGIAAKEAEKEEKRAEEFFQAEAERKLEEHRAQWDSSMHKLGDKEYSGAELHAMYEWLKDPKNQDAMDEEIMNCDGVSREEAKRRRTELQEYLALLEKQRNNEKLSAAEQKRLAELAANKTVQQNVEALKQKNLKGMLAEIDNRNIEMITGNESVSVKKGASELANDTKKYSVQNNSQGTWSYSASVVKAEGSLSEPYNVAAVGKVEPQQAPSPTPIPANSSTLAKAVGISEASPY